MIPVIILNWNGENDTVGCLKSIRDSVPAGFVPVLVDNGSSVGSLKKLRCECSHIFSKVLFLSGSELSEKGGALQDVFSAYQGEDSLVFIENGENLGFAKGNNVGIRFAELAGAEWVMLLNNDTVVAPEMFRELRTFREAHPSFVAITPQIRYHTPNTRIQNCGGELTFFGGQKYRFADMDASAAAESDFSVVTFITGCALFFRYKHTGTLTEDFFFGEEDYEFALRMEKLGLAMACSHRAVVYHKRGATIGRSSRPLGAILVYYVNRLANTRNYYSKFRWRITKMLAYFYLPVLLGRKGINPRNAISAIRRIESCLKRSRGLDGAEFRSLVMCNW